MTVIPFAFSFSILDIEGGAGGGGTPPPTRLISWEQLVLENDPTFQRDRLQPWIYQFSNNRLFYSPVAPYAPLPDAGLANDGGLLILTDPSGYPTSDAGLPPGAVWNNGLAISVVPGAVPQAGASPMIFGRLTASQLMLFGGGNIPASAPVPDSLQLWNNGGVICVA